MQKQLKYFAAALIMIISGCATLADMKITKESLDDSLRNYNQMVRWQEGPSAFSFVCASYRSAAL